MNNHSTISTRGVSNNKQSTPLKYWFLTWNNYTLINFMNLDSKVRELCERWMFQEEIGEQGTPHIQGTFTFKKRIRVETLLNLFPGSFWQKSRSEASVNYCSKPSFEGAMRSQWPEALIIIKPTHPIFEQIENMCGQPPVYRRINWYWESNGNIGKSAFCKYMYVQYKANIITTTRSADIVTAIEDTDKIVIFDFPRCANPHVYCPFTAIEQICNGFITDAKLKKKARTVIMNPPHVIVFANEPPDTRKVSSDRWKITEITPP